MSRGRLAAALGMVAGALALTSTSVHGQEADLEISISGRTEVGQNLRAEVRPSGDHKYDWYRCRTRARDTCDRRIGGSRNQMLTSSHVGRWIRVRVTPPEPEPTPTPEPTVDPSPTPDPPPPPTPLGAVRSAAAAPVPVWSEPVGPVTARPVPSPAPTPDAPAAPPPAFSQQGPPPALAPAPRFLNPFPVVRIRGTVAERGAQVSLLRVTAPNRATVKIRCKSRHCPIKRRARGPGRIRAFERFLPAGVKITIRVRRQARIGKYVRFKVRARKPPARRDACVVPGNASPVDCPPA